MVSTGNFSLRQLTFLFYAMKVILSIIYLRDDYFNNFVNVFTYIKTRFLYNNAHFFGCREILRIKTVQINISNIFFQIKNKKVKDTQFRYYCNNLNNSCEYFCGLSCSDIILHFPRQGDL